MKLLFFSHDSGLYGASRSMVNIIQGLQNLGVFCKVILPNEGPLELLLKEKKIEYNIIFYPWWTTSIGYFQGDNVSKGFLEYLTKGLHKVSIFSKIIRPVFVRKNIKLIKDFDLIISNTSVISTGFFFASILRLPHVWFIREFGDLDFGIKFILGKKFAAKIFQRSELIIFNSGAVASHYSKNYKIKEEHSMVLYNGLYYREEFIQKKKLRALSKKHTGQIVFCIVGNVFKAKGQWEAVDAIAELNNEFPNIQLWIIGGGAIDELMKYIATKNLEKFVSCFGFLEDVKSVFLEMDCLLVCSKFEAFGRAAVEAMAYGIPVIGNDSGGTSEIIENEKTGLLYQGDTEGLALCMKRIITNQNLGETFAENGWRMAYERFNIENCSQKFFNEIGKLIK